MTHRIASLVVLFFLLACTQRSDTSGTAATSSRGKGGAASNGASIISTKVVVHATGLCVFVHQTEPQPKMDPMTLELAKSANHHPILLYPASEESTPPPANRNVSTYGGKKYFDFIGEEISFDPSSATQLSYAVTPSSDCVHDGSFYFLPHLRALAKAKAKDPESLTLGDIGAEYKKGTQIAAAFDITFGQLFTIVSNPIVWDFRPENSTEVFHTQAIAQQVNWQFNIPGTVLTIRTRSLGGGSSATPSDLMTLKAVGGEIHLMVANVVASDIDVLTGKAAMHKPQPVDDHFQMYFDFIHGYTGPRPRPVFSSICLTGLTNDQCVAKPFVDFQPAPSGCPANINKVTVTVTPALTIGGLNCGPDQVP